MNFYQTIYKKIYGDFNIWTDVNCDANKIDLVINNPRQYDNMFSELRLGTLLQQSGYTLKKPFLNSESYINCNIDSITFDPLKPGYYHPIKTIV